MTLHSCTAMGLDSHPRAMASLAQFHDILVNCVWQDKQLYKWAACIALRAGAKEVFRRRTSNFGDAVAHPSLLTSARRVRSLLKATRALSGDARRKSSRLRALSPSQFFRRAAARGRGRGMTISGEVTDEVDDEGLPVAVSRAYTAGAMFLRSSAGEKYLVKDVLLRLVLGGDGSAAAGGGFPAARYGAWWASDPTGRVLLKAGERDGADPGDGASSGDGGEYAPASVRVEMRLRSGAPPGAEAAAGAAEDDEGDALIGGGGSPGSPGAPGAPRRAWGVGALRWSFAGGGAAAAVRGDAGAAWAGSVPLGDVTEVAILEGLEESAGQPILNVRFRGAGGGVGACPWVRFTAEPGAGGDAEDGDFIYKWAAVLLLAMGFAQELDLL